MGQHQVYHGVIKSKGAITTWLSRPLHSVPKEKIVHFFERQTLPLRVSALFSEFFISFSTASHQKRGLPLMIFANHFETAPCTYVIEPP